MKKFLRLLGILLMGITAAVTLLGGIGTTCVALNPTKYESMKAIASLQWLYILYVILGVALGILGIRATIMLVRGKRNAEKNTLVTLAAGLVVGLIHMATSRALRGSSMPVDGVVYITALTLIIFLLFRLPRIQAMKLFDRDDKEPDQAGGLTAIVIGLLVLFVQYWAGPTHIMGGTNYANAFHNGMSLSGAGVILLGTGMIASSIPAVRALITDRIQAASRNAN